MEVPMTAHNPVTDREDAAFDSTLKTGGIVIVLLAIAVAAFWYFS